MNFDDNSSAGIILARGIRSRHADQIAQLGQERLKVGPLGPGGSPAADEIGDGGINFRCRGQ